MTPVKSQAQQAKSNTSTLVSRNITTDGRRTSVRLEPEMWHGMMDICRRERASIHEVCTAIARHKAANTSLTAAIRVFIMAYFRTAATEDGHAKAGHGRGLLSITLTSGGAHAPLAAPLALRSQAYGNALNGTRR